MENKQEMLSCLAFVKHAIETDDRDCLRSYYEQLNDFVIQNTRE